MVLHRDTGEKNLIWKRSTPCAQVLVVVTLQNCDCTPEFPSDASNPESRSKTAILYTNLLILISSVHY